MTDDQYNEIIEFLKRHAIPPLPPMLPHGLGVPLLVEDTNAPPRLETAEEHGQTRIVVNHEDYSDLERRTRREYLDRGAMYGPTG